MDCTQLYIGHTAMWLESRIQHHKSNAKNGTKTNTALSLHLINKNHKADWDNVQVLHNESKTTKRRILESIYIHKFEERILNDRLEIGKLGMMYAELLSWLK